jgi:hypothetical protein
MEPSQRDAAVRAFQSEQGPDVLLLSDVGSQGLNLHRGSVVIFVVSLLTLCIVYCMGTDNLSTQLY